MFAALSPAEYAAIIMVPVTVLYLVLLFSAFRLRSLERTLIVAGLLTGIFAVWYSLAIAEGAVQVRAGPAAVSLGGDATGLLGRIAALLILSGLAVIILNATANGASMVSRREEGIRE